MTNVVFIEVMWNALLAQEPCTLSPETDRVPTVKSDDRFLVKQS